MAKDYAKKRKRNGKKRKKSNSQSNLWLLVLLIIGAIVAGLFYLNQQKINQHRAEKTTQPKANPPQPKQPTFDFYTILSNKPPATKTPPPAPLPTNTSSTQQQQFVLQVASVKTFADADRLKAQLILLGFNVFVEKIKLSGNLWNRVYVGPYPTLTQANADQQRLQQDKINSILVKYNP